MTDQDWRVTVTLPDEHTVQRALQAVHEHEIEEDMRHRLGNRVAVSADGNHIFLYAASENAAREADRVARDSLAQRQLTGEFTLDRWHPVEQEWEDAGAPLPQTAEQLAAEHERLIADENEETREQGEASWEVRAELRSRHEAFELAERLRADGYPVSRRWKYVVIGARNEDDAKQIAEVVQGEAPLDASVHPAPVPFVPFGLARLRGIPFGEKL